MSFTAQSGRQLNASDAAVLWKAEFTHEPIEGSPPPGTRVLPPQRR